MASSRQEYLKRYTSGPEIPKKKKKKAKASKPPRYGGAITIVDDDAFWQKEIKEESPDDEDDRDDAPLVIKDVEVLRMQKMEALKMHRPYLSMANDGSGWVEVSDVPRQELGSSARVVKTVPSSQRDICSPDKNWQDSSDSSPERKILHGSLGPSSSGKDFGRSHHQSPDVSPSRKGRQDTLDLSPPRLHSGRSRRDSSDLSPPRKGRQETPDLSPSRLHSGRSRRDSPDLSPPRKGRQGTPNLSPPRLPSGRVRHDSPDLSLLRIGRQEAPDLSPPRFHSRRIHHDNPGLSPPRKGRQDASDLTPTRLPSGRSRQDSPDLSFPRKGRQESLDLPTRRKGREESLDLSPSRLPSGRSHHGVPALSPPRKGRQESLDLSPQRKGRQGTPDLSPPRQKRQHATSDGSPAGNGMRKREKMADGTAAGLQSRGELIEQIKHRKQEENRRFSEMDVSVSGRAADTVYRDRHGKRLESLDELMKLQQAEKAPKAKPLEWGKGLAQKKEAEALQVELEAEKLKPFARSRDDPDLDKDLKERVRWGDPMAYLVKKRTSEPVLEDLGESKEMRDSGFIVPQDIPKHSWLKRGITPPPNRYGIKPGRHWDGVDRSSGFEKDMYKRQNEKKANELEAYLWSVSDM